MNPDYDVESVGWNGPSYNEVQDPSGDYSAMPAMHIQGFDEAFPGYEPSYGDKVAQKWNETLDRLFSPQYWEDYFKRVADNWNSNELVQGWQDLLGQLFELGPNATASYCMLICGALGTSSGAVGVGPRVGGGFEVGVSPGQKPGPFVAMACAGSLGPAGAYIEGGINSDGTTFSGGGWSPGAQLGCTLLVGIAW
jgi:hypothetical protein